MWQNGVGVMMAISCRIEYSNILSECCKGKLGTPGCDQAILSTVGTLFKFSATSVFWVVSQNSTQMACVTYAGSMNLSLCACLLSWENLCLVSPLQGELLLPFFFSMHFGALIMQQVEKGPCCSHLWWASNEGEVIYRRGRACKHALTLPHCMKKENAPKWLKMA